MLDIVTVILISISFQTLVHAQNPGNYATQLLFLTSKYTRITYNLFYHKTIFFYTIMYEFRFQLLFLCFNTVTYTIANGRYYRTFFNDTIPNEFTRSMQSDVTKTLAENSSLINYNIYIGSPYTVL